MDIGYSAWEGFVAEGGTPTTERVEVFVPDAHKIVIDNPKSVIEEGGLRVEGESFRVENIAPPPGKPGLAE